MIKCVIFDLDGVLVDTKQLHFDALNLALKDIDNKYVISKEEHLKIYDGLPTKSKLELLHRNKGLDKIHFDKVWKDKQLYTYELIERQDYGARIFSLFSYLKENKGYKIYIATNSIKDTTKQILNKLGVLDIVDGFFTNEDIKYAKPNPEIYLRVIAESGFYPNECLILEDSIHGVLAAQNSCANIMVINKLDDVNTENIMSEINFVDGNQKSKKFPLNGNIVIPIAGKSSRFEQAGFTLPKYLLDTINNKTMIEMVLDSLGIEGHFIYIVRKEHADKYNIEQMLKLITPNCDVIIEENPTGAARSVLESKNLINNDKPLIIANCDQYIEWNPREFLYLMNNQNVDGGILTFKATSPKWSFAKIDENGYVSEVAEKKPISDNATVGIYYYKHGSDFVRYAEEMISQDIRTNGEFYVCPVYNQFIKDGKKIKAYEVDKMVGCGTPEDLTNLISLLK